VTAEEALETARGMGATFRLELGEISVQAPSPLPAILMRELRQHKGEIRSLLSAGPAPYSPGEAITSLARLKEVAEQADRVPVPALDLTDYGAGPVTGWQPLSTTQVEGHALLACACPRVIGGADRGDCCPICEMAMTCPDCGKCRGCRLMLRLDSMGPPQLRKKSRAARRQRREEDDE
jgi:hypothetical protein